MGDELMAWGAEGMKVALTERRGGARQGEKVQGWVAFIQFMPAEWPTDANMCQPLVVRQSGRVPGLIVRLYSCNGAWFSRIPPHASVAHSTTGQ